MIETNRIENKEKLTDNFVLNNNFLRVIFVSNYGNAETTQETTQETTRYKIINLLKANNKYTKKDLMTLLNKGDSTIKEHLDKLKKDGAIKRIGATKSGYWQIANEK